MGGREAYPPWSMEAWRWRQLGRRQRYCGKKPAFGLLAVWFAFWGCGSRFGGVIRVCGAHAYVHSSLGSSKALVNSKADLGPSPHERVALAPVLFGRVLGLADGV